jgi:hypothetical protein
VWPACHTASERNPDVREKKFLNVKIDAHFAQKHGTVGNLSVLLPFCGLHREVLSVRASVC